MTPQEQVVARFVEAINAHNAEALLAFMTEDHRLADAGDCRVTGHESLRRAWNEYWTWMPDYRIEVQNMLSRGETVGVFGTARGTYAPDGRMRPENQWAIPAAWRAVVRGGHVAEWQVYADNSPVSEIMEGYRPE